MKAKVINDNKQTAFDHVERLKRLSGIDEAQSVWANSIGDICSQIEPGDIVILDVNLGELGQEGGFDVFFELYRQHGVDVLIVFDSAVPCRGDLERQLNKPTSPLDTQRLKELMEASRVVFIEDYNRDIIKAVQKIVGFSIQDAIKKLFGPFQPLHIAVQHIQSNELPNQQTFAPIKDGDNEFDFYGWLEYYRQAALEYLKNPLIPYAQRVGCEEHVAPISQFLSGALAKLCQLLERKTAPDERLAEVKSRVFAGGDCASFLNEFQGAIGAVSVIATCK
jgi:hypothetical protein